MFMQKFFRCSSLSFLFLVVSFCVFGQGNKAASFSALSIGDKMPLSVWNKLPKKPTTKLVILDFWSTGCTSCMEAFPHMEELQERFPEQLQVVLMNPWEDEAKVKERMSKMNVGRLKNEMRPYAMSSVLPAITGDTVFKQLFPARSVPHHVWIDGNRTVLFITHGYNATPEHVLAFLNGEKLHLSVKNDLFGAELLDKGYVQPTLAGCDISYYSVFAPFFSAGASMSQRRDTAKGFFRKTWYNEDVISFMRTAFVDYRKRPRILLEMKDKEKFRVPDYHKEANRLDYWNKQFRFTYDLLGPIKDETNWQQRMQFDVNSFFGSLFGIKADMEARRFNCLILVKTKDLLKTTGGEGLWKLKDSLWRIQNYPFSEVVNLLYSKLENLNISRPFIDETGIDPKLKVDMQLTGDLKDVDNLRKQLQLYGLDLISGDREVDVLVIRDKK